MKKKTKRERQARKNHSATGNAAAATVPWMREVPLCRLDGATTADQRRTVAAVGCWSSPEIRRRDRPGAEKSLERRREAKLGCEEEEECGEAASVPPRPHL
jgi:hypothetical protein